MVTTFRQTGSPDFMFFYPTCSFRSLANLLYTVGVIPITFLKAIMKLVEEL